jgi:hypothetical protein
MWEEEAIMKKQYSWKDWGERIEVKERQSDWGIEGI